MWCNIINNQIKGKILTKHECDHFRDRHAICKIIKYKSTSIDERNIENTYANNHVKPFLL